MTAKYRLTLVNFILYIGVLVAPTDRKKPANPLNTVKKRVKENDMLFDYSDPYKNPLNTAFYHFGWHEDDIKKALLRLNDRYHSDDPPNNHFHKHAPHRDYPKEDTHVDYYKAYNLMLKCDVYTHFHIRENRTQLVIDSFHQL